jgi:hypothetical protein
MGAGTHRFCSRRGVAVSSVNFIVASLQLQLVQSLISAIRTADLTSAAHNAAGGSPNPADSFCCGDGRSITCEPRYLPRPVLHPTPRYLPRPVIHPQPRVAPSPLPPPIPSAKTPHITPGPPPPWKTLPCGEPGAAQSVIKMIVQRPDTLTKGTLIDLFL